MSRLKESFRQYKWVLLAGVVVAILIGLITANLHVLQFISYKVQNNTEGIISILQSHVKNEDEMKDWFFVQGMDYLVAQEEYPSETTEFFEENFNTFPFETQKKIIKAYNSKQLNLLMNKDLMDLLEGHVDDDIIKAYIKRLKPDELEQGLFFKYGENPQIDETLVNGLSSVLSIYPQKLNFNKFNFSLYDLLSYSGEKSEEQIKVILEKIPAETARENIFKVLQTKTITEEEISALVKFLYDTNLISNNEYTTFNNTYSEICLIRNQYKGLDQEQIELQNKKDQVDVQISDSIKQLQVKQAEAEEKKKQVSEIEAKINELTNYTHMALYVEKAAGTGDNEYMASVPRNSLFGFISSNQKYIVKLQDASLANSGMQYLNVYFKGTKKSKNGQEYGYYVEVTNSDLGNISNLENERKNKLEALAAVQAEASVLENKIEAIKTENNYAETQEALKNIVAKRDELSTKLSEKTILIKELFGLKDLRITIES